jgi:hypothetical protein
LHAGAAFAAFVGDPHKWGATFYDAYVNEKHLISRRRPANELQPLASSAQLLLIIILLNRAARRQQPSHVLLSDYRVSPLGDRVRSLLGLSP